MSVESPRTDPAAVGPQDDAFAQHCAPIDREPPAAQLQALRERVAALGARAIFLVHYYQPTWIKRLLRDVPGVQCVVADSQALAQRGHDSDAELLFCVTVPFMAGSSAILARAGQRVVLADPDAGCSLEQSAPLDLVQELFERLDRLGIDFVPVCYTNIGADVKALTGERGGIIHTSSSAIAALGWAQARGKTPVFLPDRHLADNVAAEAGLGRLARWQRERADGGVSDEVLRQAQMIVWDGECSVHVKTDGEVIRRFARERPGSMLLLHPEVPNAHIRVALETAGRERVGVGSTLFIRRQLAEIAERAPGSAAGIATESNFVQELQGEFEGRVQVINLLRNVCACVHMRTRPEQMLAALDVALAADGLASSRHLVVLDPATVAQARRALSRSLELEQQAFSLDWA